MSHSMKIVLGIIGFIVVLGLVIAVFSYRLINKSLPDYAETVVLPDLQEPVQVFWDEYRIPHIYAKNSPDMFRVAGYICAQERLWQMEFYRRIVRGTLSEIFGSSTLNEDRLFRTLGFNRTASKIAENLDRDSRAALEAFVQGINGYIKSHHDRLPIEFSILNVKPDPWKITDSIGFIRVMGFQLSFAWHSELAIAEIAARFGAPMAKQLFPDYPEDAPLIVSGENKILTESFAALLAEMQKARYLTNLGGGVAASNSWVVSGEKSKTGKPILANDPHLGLGLPSIWYEMHLVSDRYDVMGVAMPLAPGIVIGQNRAAAWGLTNGMVDDADFYIERIHPQDSTLYWDGQAWQKMKIVREKINVKGAEGPVFMDIRFTRHGPIVSDIHPLLRTDTLAVSFRWTGFEVSNELSAFLRLNRADNWQEFIAATRGFKVPAQNVIFADTSGTIGYYAAGDVPIRRDGKGYFMYKGWEMNGDWVDHIPYAKMPHVKNPPKGFIATANNKMIEKFPYYLGNGWEPDSRIRRIVELLEKKEKLSPEDFRLMQADLVSVHARKVLPKLVSILEAESLNKEERKILKLLQDWQFVETPGSPAATLYNVLFVDILENALKDEMGDTLYNEFVFWSNFPIRAMENLINHPDSDWWDDANTPEKENRDDIVLRSFRESLKFLGERLGKGPGFWDWGRLHQLTLQHVLGRKSPLNRIFNRGPFSIGGSANTISKAEFSYSAPYHVKVGASMRQIVNLAQPLQGFRVIPGGQSGQPFSDFYDDQIPLWLDGKYKSESLDQTKIKQSAAVVQEFLATKPEKVK